MEKQNYLAIFLKNVSLYINFHKSAKEKIILLYLYLL